MKSAKKNGDIKHKSMGRTVDTTNRGMLAKNML
jgi:hypothetical protein